MKITKTIPLEQKWKERLDLSTRKPPEFYEKADEVMSTPHAGAIRTTFRELDVSGIFCVQDVPTIVILSVDEYDREAIVDLHGALWNQGLTSLLLVLSGDTVRVFSLARKPYFGENEEFHNRCLIQELNAIADALVLKNLVYGAESGRLWADHADYFDSQERIDQVLLDNLTASYQLLCKKNLSPNESQALLIQAMFIAYLEDRAIIDQSYFHIASDGLASTFLNLLKSTGANSLGRLFRRLREDINGNLFVAPCSFEETRPHTRLTQSHLEILARFRSGHEEMGAGQYRFWGYDFKYIPIELISAVYDRFLGEREEAERRQQGAYYTPMFLADTAISQVWDTLSFATRDKGHFLDPACRSGVFLVRLFQRLCEHWRETRKPKTIPWGSLLAILSRLHGWDINSGAVRVAVFSLYVALLEEVSPPDIRLLIKHGKLLPDLWGHNLREQDFFEVQTDGSARMDVLIGNPPWSSRRGTNRSSVEWCSAEHLPMPGNEDAWAFVWKSLRHLREGGVIAFLLPAMGFLHNHAYSAVAARNRFMRDARVFRIINFADLRFQLFKNAVRPAAMIVFGPAVHLEPAYRFDYWTPKADLNLKIKRLITLSSADKCLVTSRMAETDPYIFKRRLWMNNPEAKLFNYLLMLPRLGALVKEYGTQRRKNIMDENQWLIGQGFQPFNADQSAIRPKAHFTSDYVGQLAYMPIRAFEPLAQPVSALSPWPSNHVRRKGFEQGFTGPRVLIPRGVDTKHMRLRAAYLEEPLTFQHIIQALVVPFGNERRAKLLTAILNSRLMLWFAFHGTASFGSDRPEVQQAELMRLPFPVPNDMSEPQKSETAEKELVFLIDEMRKSVSDPFRLKASETDVFRTIDHLTYQFFCLSDEEITLIDDTVEKIIPAVQPRESSFPDVWKLADSEDRRNYATTLVRSMAEWFDRDRTVGIRLEARNDDLAILRLTLEDDGRNSNYIEENSNSVGEALAKIFEHIHQPLPGNFQLIPDFRMFIGNNLYLVKPAQKRFWLKSTALTDADAIALDLQDAATFQNSRYHA